MLSVARSPCSSCPYRRDVPSGVWGENEYDKLPHYDGETWEQDMSLFMCHQRDGRLCAGWLACHGPGDLLALRFWADDVDPAVWRYRSDVPVFGSGAEAREHGIRDIENPGPEAQDLIDRLTKKLERTT